MENPNLKWMRTGGSPMTQESSISFLHPVLVASLASALRTFRDNVGQRLGNIWGAEGKKLLNLPGWTVVSLEFYNAGSC